MIMLDGVLEVFLAPGPREKIKRYTDTRFWDGCTFRSLRYRKVIILVKGVQGEYKTTRAFHCGADSFRIELRPTLLQADLSSGIDW